MANMNLVVIAGRLTSDPQVKQANNTTVCNFSIATDRSFKDRDGEWKKETLYIDAAAFGRMAENIGKYLAKGRNVLVRGSLRLNSWEEKNTGIRRSKISIMVDECQFLDPKDGTTNRRESDSDTNSREAFP